MKVTIETPELMESFGQELAAQLVAGDLVLLAGELGAGKTTLTRGIGAGLRATGTVQSPTFVLARTHKTASGPDLVHVDAYRLGSALELDDLDIDFANSIVIIEWARHFLDDLFDHWLLVSIDRSNEQDIREVEIIGHGKRWEGVQFALSD
ncbi:MAG: tRNA (adenosine(37)-N6)-threonylcarbamoyltransferase complex ATPase subunit type 1 TsaE [Aquiluna sp.]|nr:tRNA (adenosine(37)-N6)-threonylcarbamoyltransferase complex ATPase subunit type 1 TsaE [Aquiluna sp.]